LYISGGTLNLTLDDGESNQANAGKSAPPASAPDR
jgi:hypothetical protein